MLGREKIALRRGGGGGRLSPFFQPPPGGGLFCGVANFSKHGTGSGTYV